MHKPTTREPALKGVDDGTGPHGRLNCEHLHTLTLGTGIAEILVPQSTPHALILGISLRDKLHTPIISSQINNTLRTEIGQLTRALAVSHNAESFSTILTEDGHLFFGVSRKFSHPNCEASSIECATGIAATSGHHSFALVATYSRSIFPPFNGVQLERLAEHFCSPIEREMQLIHVSDSDIKPYSHNQLLPHPGAGHRRPTVRPVSLPAFRKFDFNLGENADFALEIPESAVEELMNDLRARVTNSTADGETRPGKKRHAACVFTTDGHVYFGVNLRSDIGTLDRCAEWNALGAAALGGHANKIAGVMVYSPDYPSDGSVSCCGRCRDSLGDSIDPALGDMVVLYVGRNGLDHYDLFTDLKNIPYGKAEKGASS